MASASGTDPSPASPPPAMGEPPPRFVQAPRIDPGKLERLMAQARFEQNIGLAILGGGAAAVVAAGLWAAITVITDYQVGLMAIGVGWLVGLAVRTFGRGVDRSFGVVAAGLSLIGCLAGNFLTLAVIVARQESASILEVLEFLVTNPSVAVEGMAFNFSVIDLLFYGIAVFQGYRSAFRRFTQAELASVMV